MFVDLREKCLYNTRISREQLPSNDLPAALPTRLMYLLFLTIIWNFHKIWPPSLILSSRSYKKLCILSFNFKSIFFVSPFLWLRCIAKCLLRYEWNVCGKWNSLDSLSAVSPEYRGLRLSVKSGTLCREFKPLHWL